MCLIQYKAHYMPVLYVNNGTKRDKITFSMFLIIFEYARSNGSNAEWCQVPLCMQRL